MEKNTSNPHIIRIKKALEMKNSSELRNHLYALKVDNSLSDLEFFDILGEIFNLKPKFFTEQLYKDIKKKIRKLNGDEGVKFMEHYLIKNCGLFSPKHIIDIIKEEYKKADPAKDLNWRLHLPSKISTIFSDLLSKKEYQHLSNSDFHFIVGEIYKLNPDFFIDLLYDDLMSSIDEISSGEMDHYLKENFNIIPESRTSKSETKKTSLKTKIILYVCVICSLILGLTATGLYINLAITLEGSYGQEVFLAQRALLIPIMFIVGFFLPLIAFPLGYVCDVCDA